MKKAGSLAVETAFVRTSEQASVLLLLLLLAW